MPDDRRDIPSGVDPEHHEQADALGRQSSEEVRRRQEELRARTEPDEADDPAPRQDEPGPVYPGTVRDLER